MATRADSTPAPISRRRPAALSAAPGRRGAAPSQNSEQNQSSDFSAYNLSASDRARVEDLIERLISLLDARDAPLADMEPDDDGEAEPAEASLQPVERRLASNVIRFPLLQRRVKIDWPEVPLPISDEVLPHAPEDRS